MKDKSPMMTLKQVAAYLQVSKAHLSNLINNRVPGAPRLRFFRIGRRVLFKPTWVEDWLEAGDSRPEPR